jgi:hypothetical protein
MRVACTPTLKGNVYRFYRDGYDATLELKPIVPFLVASRVEMLIGPVDDDEKLLLLVGPISGSDEAALLGLVEPFISEHRPPPTA